MVMVRLTLRRGPHRGPPIPRSFWFLCNLLNRMSSFAVVPAAGNSTRMGSDKRLLPWQGRTLIEHCLDAWLASSITAIVIVIRPSDDELIPTLRRYPVEVVIPQAAPTDMKASIQLGLARLKERFAPLPSDCWLMAPADMPQLNSQIIDAVISTHAPEDPAVVVPTHQGRRGHPVLFPWIMHAQVFNLGTDEGVNLLVRRGPVREVQLDNLPWLTDIDHPHDYRRLLDNDV